MPARNEPPKVNKSITWLTSEGDREWFPPVEQALDEPEGLLAAGGDLAPARLLAAYRRGIFPWYSASRCCGGRRIRVKSCGLESSDGRAAFRKRCEIVALR